VKLKEGPIKRDRYSGLSVSDIFDISAYVHHQHQSDEYFDLVAAVKAEAAKIKDEIMLGDQQAALELLRKFDA